jgi:hypothetical protein
MDALAITGDCHVVTIASGECNVLSYLTAEPAKAPGFPVVGHGIAARDPSLRWDDGMTAESDLARPDLNVSILVPQSA